jgi:glycolate oxidase iron-sulfur subunit
VQEGRIVSTADLERSITQCTLCLACVSECPSGVALERVFLEARRELADRLGVGTVKGMALNLVARQNRLLPAVARLAWAGQWLAGTRLPGNTGLRLRFPMGSLGTDRLLPAFARVPLRGQLPTVSGQGGSRGRVAYFTGCFDNYFDPAVGRSVSKVLTVNGYQVIVPPDQGCCALPMLANGLRDVALGLMRDNVRAMLAAEPDVIVTACASCGNALRHLYVDTFEAAGDAEWAEKAAGMAALTRDISELLVERGYERPTAALDRAVTYHDPCHLVRGQSVSRQPRDLLRSLPGVELVEQKQADRCCGGGGTFSFSHPELAKRVQERKIASIGSTGAGVVVTGCPGCKLQLNDGLRRAGSPARVVHTVQLLAEAYG